MKKNEPIPQGWALDGTGMETRDAAAAFGANRLMPLGGSELNSGYKVGINFLSRLQYLQFLVW